MKKTTLFDIAAFIIPAIIAFISYRHGDTLDKIGYAFAIGLAWAFEIMAITRISEDEFRQTAPISKKVSMIVYIIAYPIIYVCLYNFYSKDGGIGVGGALATTFLGFFIAYLIGYIAKFIVRVFEK